MLTRILYAVVLWIAVALVCIIIGSLLLATGFTGIAVLAELLKTYSWLIGFIAAAFYFLRGSRV